MSRELVRLQKVGNVLADALDLYVNPSTHDYPSERKYRM